MVGTHIYCFSAPEGKYLEPAISLHPIELRGTRFTWISYPWSESCICATLMKSGMNHETLKWKAFPFSLMGWAK
jgi:hypothetical protein